MKDFSTCSLCRCCPVSIDQTNALFLNDIRAFLQRDIPFFTGPTHGWRMKAKLAVRGTIGDVKIGLFREGSHEVVDISNCPAHHPAINTAIEQLREAMIRLKIAPYDEAKGSGAIRYAQFFVSRITERVQLVIVSRDREAAQRLARSLWNERWHSIWINIHPLMNNRIFGDQWILCFGEPYLFQPGPIAFHPGAFAQANLSLFDRLLDQTNEWIQPHSKILEIYAGVGMISLHAKEKNIKQAVLVENNPFAHESFLNSSPPSHYQYVTSDAKGAIPYLTDADCIIVDPPRKGLDRDLLHAITNTNNKELIYISCSLESFRKDAKQLFDSQWKLVDAGLYWLFPGTEHVEIATKWKKN